MIDPQGASNQRLPEELRRRNRRAWRLLLALAGAMLAIAVGASLAVASTEDIIAPSDPDNPEVGSGWQAGTCRSEIPECNVENPGQFFEQAAGHPQFGFTQIIVRHEPPGQKPIGELKTVRVDLPVGLSVNPQATPQCKQSDFEAKPVPLCDPKSKVGESIVTGADPILGEEIGPLKADVYNIVPPEGEPARFGFELAGNYVYLEASVAWESDYHEGFTIHVPSSAELTSLLGVGGLILKNRFVFNGRAGNGTFITTPTTCFGPAIPGPFQQVYSTWLLASSTEEEEKAGYVFPSSAQPPLESRIPYEPPLFPAAKTYPKECDAIPLKPSISNDPKTTQTDSPSGPVVDVRVPFEEPDVLELANDKTKPASSQVRKGEVTLPAGMGLNPSAATGLETCTEAQFGKGTKNAVACPAASRIGTVHIDTPPLPEGSIEGPVFVAQQLSRDPTSGQEYRIFVDGESPRYGISARLIGSVSANPLTGQLTTTFDDPANGGLPQVPFSSFKIDFNDGPRAVLTSPPICGPNTTSTTLTPWSSAPGQIPAGQEGGPSDNPLPTAAGDFSLTSLPGGGGCPKTMAERPFAPSFGAGSVKPVAGAFSPYRLEIGRSDGNQELKGVDIVLPPGHTAKLKGLKYCPASAIAAAAANSGAAEAATPSCPSNSFIGTAVARSGSGSEPIEIFGKAFLAGPYRGAPLSMAVVTPATAGPFDLGVVVVRVALFVEPRTGQIHAVSDPIPHVFGGALLDLRSVVVTTDRPNFSVNPTSCSPPPLKGSLRGGGANPLDPAAFSSFPVSSTQKMRDCKKLGFKPRLFMRVFGATKRARNPKFRAVLRTREGDANIAHAAVTLPRSMFLDQSSLQNVCTRVQFAADQCPKNSRYGYARAFTPMLDEPLKGPVYLRSSDNLLPDLVADLHGQVDIELVGRIDTNKGRIRNTFDVVPDVATSKFILTMPGGKKGLLTNSRDLCGKKGGKAPKIKAIAKFKAHNGKKIKLKPRLRTPCGKKGKR